MVFHTYSIFHHINISNLNIDIELIVKSMVIIGLLLFVNVQLTGLLFFHDHYFTCYDRNVFIILTFLHCNHLIAFSWLGLMQVDLNIFIHLECFWVIYQNMIVISHNKWVNTFQFQNNCTLKVLLSNYWSLKIMLIFPLEDVETFLILFVCNTILPQWSKHHQRAVHKIIYHIL